MARSSALFVILLGVTALAGSVEAKVIDKNFHEQFKVGEGVRLDLRFGDGDVDIEPWDKDVLDVEVRYHADVTEVGLGGEPDFDVKFRQADGVVEIVGRETYGSRLVLFRSVADYEYVYTVRAPSYVELRLAGDDGDVNIKGWRADIDCLVDDGDVTVTGVANERTRITFEDGDVRITGLDGRGLDLVGDDGSVHMSGCTVAEARIRLEDGNLVAVKCEGNFVVGVDDGDVLLALDRTEAVHVSGTDGDVRIDVAGADNLDLDVAAEDGDVQVTLSKSLAYSFLITTGEGGVQVDVSDIEQYTRTEHSISGDVRGGGGYVRVRTSDGDVLVTESP